MSGGWTNRRAYPLLVSMEVEQAVTRYRADKNLSLGRAYNNLIREGLYSFGYLTHPLTTEEQIARKQAEETGWIRSHWSEMTDKAQQYYLRKYPQLAMLTMAG